MKTNGAQGRNRTVNKINNLQHLCASTVHNTLHKADSIPPLTHRGAYCYIYPQGLVLPRLTLIVNVTIHIKSSLEKSVEKF